ncbi:hypothetical protein HMPREF0650_0376 [Hoylesella buccalis ATCC 35310]|uniref:Uncharacterized protein n=1 Tax=Hoylesella buccalis ATCC 35310 TaxID=679190 RepID=D1W5P1_9BACT|nr:hypothetical protein [Hoylesella buccalis]EFA92138.1 hypothetical protein HMPREF0650_0376 [Hoylesella buccalis ATCC 35310]
MKVYLLKFDHKNYYGGGMVIIAANSEEEAEKLAKEEWWFYCMLDPVEYEYLTANVTEPQILAEDVYEE